MSDTTFIKTDNSRYIVSITDAIEGSDFPFGFTTSNLKSVIIGTSVTSIGERAFRLCSALQSVTIGDSVISIRRQAFDSCSALQSVTIGTSVESIGNGAFGNCVALQSVTIPDSVKSIGNGAFAGCSALQSVTIGTSVTSIGDYAFMNCSALESLTIPDSVTSIGLGALIDSSVKIFYMTSNNGLGLSEGNTIIGGANMVWVSLSTTPSTSDSPSDSIKHNLVEKKSIGGEPKLLILNNSISHARSAMPLKDLTSDNSNLFSMTRNKYVRTKFNYSSPSSKLYVTKNKKWYGNNNNNSASATSNYYQRRVNFPSTVFNINQQSMSYTNNFNVNYVQQSLQKTRSGGSRVPLKVTQKNI